MPTRAELSAALAKADAAGAMDDARRLAAAIQKLDAGTSAQPTPALAPPTPKALPAYNRAEVDAGIEEAAASIPGGFDNWLKTKTPAIDPLAPRDQPKPTVRVAPGDDPFAPPRRSDWNDPAAVAMRQTPLTGKNTNPVAEWFSKSVTPIAQSVMEDVAAPVMTRIPGGEQMARDVGGGLSEWMATTTRDPIEGANQAVEMLEPTHIAARGYNNLKDSLAAVFDGDWETAQREYSEATPDLLLGTAGILPGGSLTVSALSNAGKGAAGKSLTGQLFKPGPPPIDRAADLLMKKLKADGLSVEEIAATARSLANRGDSGVYETLSEVAALTGKSSAANLRGLAMALGAVPGPAQEALMARIATNADDLSKRLSRSATRATGQDANKAVSTLDELDTRLRTESQPRYDDAYSTPIAPDIFQNEIVGILNSEHGQAAARSALSALKTRSSTMQTKLAAAATDEARARVGTEIERMNASIRSLEDFVANPVRGTAIPTTEALDWVKRAFDDQISTSGKFTAGTLGEVKRNFAESVSRGTGGKYGEALGFYEDTKRLEDAFTFGHEALNKKTWQLQREMKGGLKGRGWSGGEIEAIAMGVARSIEDLVEANNQAALTKLLKGKALKNIATALGDPKAAKMFEQSIQRLGANREWGRRVAGGSDTAMRQAAIKDATHLEEDAVTRVLDRAETAQAPPSAFGAFWTGVIQPNVSKIKDLYRDMKYKGIHDEDVNAQLGKWMATPLTPKPLDDLMKAIEARAMRGKKLPPPPQAPPPKAIPGNGRPPKTPPIVSAEERAELFRDVDAPAGPQRSDAVVVDEGAPPPLPAFIENATQESLEAAQRAAIERGEIPPVYKLFKDDAGNIIAWDGMKVSHAEAREALGLGDKRLRHGQFRWGSKLGKTDWYDTSGAAPAGSIKSSAIVDDITTGATPEEITLPRQPWVRAMEEGGFDASEIQLAQRYLQGRFAGQAPEQIAEKLGVPPESLQHSVASLQHRLNQAQIGVDLDVGSVADTLKATRAKASEMAPPVPREMLPAKDLIIGYNDGDSALAVALDLNIPDYANMSRVVTNQWAKLRQRVLTAKSQGASLERLADELGVTPDELERFAAMRPHPNKGGYEKSIERIVTLLERAEKSGNPMRPKDAAARLGMSPGSVGAMLSMARTGAKPLPPELVARVKALKITRGRPIELASHSPPEAGGGALGTTMGAVSGADMNGDGVITDEDRVQAAALGGAGGVFAGWLSRGRRVDPNKPGSFGGSMSKTADHRARRIAEQMEAAGAGRDQIWRETGWYKGVDGKWKYEIDDRAFKIKGDKARKGFWGSLRQAADDADAGGAYPRLAKKTKVFIEPEPPGATPGASHETDLARPKKGSIISVNLPDPEAFRSRYGETPVMGAPYDQDAVGRSMLLHERQHGIQAEEGFARGADSSAPAPQSDIDAVARRLFADRAAAEGRLDLTWDTLPQSVRDQFTNRARIDIYKRHAGEVEARNVQTRRDYTPDERRARPPWTTQDTPDEDQIVKFLYGDTQSATPMGDAPKKAQPQLSRAEAEALRELRAARAAHTRAANRYVMKDDRDKYVAPLLQREIRAEQALAKVRQAEAAAKLRGAKVSDFWDKLIGGEGREIGIAVGTTLGAGATMAGLAAATHGPDKDDGPMDPRDPRWYWSTVVNDEDAMAEMQIALDEWGLWPDQPIDPNDPDQTPRPVEMTGTFGKTTKAALAAWRHARGLDPAAPMSQLDVARLLAGPRGYQDKADRSWRYSDGGRVALP